LISPATGLIDLHKHVRVIPGQEITLALDVWRPEAVDHVTRCAVNADWLSNWDMDFVSRGDHPVRLGLIGILHFPPSVMTVHIDRESLLFVHPAKPSARNEAAYKHDKEQEDRKTHCASNRAGRKTIASFGGALRFRYGMERMPSAPHEINQDGQREKIYGSSDPEKQCKRVLDMRSGRASRIQRRQSPTSTLW
jgi:hypothetical protein